MKARWFLVAVVIGVLTSNVATATEESSDIKVVDRVKSRPSQNAQLPTEFNDGRPFVISLNLTIPGSEAMKTNLFSTLTEKKVGNKIVILFFSSKAPPEYVTLKFGSRVPLDIAQSVIKAATQTPGIRITLVLQKLDGDFGDTQRVYIGGLLQHSKRPVTQDKLDALLNDQLSLEEFHKLILQN